MEDLAFKANVSRDTISRLENGDPSVSFETVINVCNALGISDELTTATDPYENPYGRLRADQELPKRIRN
jgi:transcriptional regulator with XRE-family HTH domain